jgi:hypothetical protein
MTTIDLFTDLEVLSMLKEENKICIRDGRIAIEKQGHPISQALRRWIYNDSRRLSIMQINTVITQSLQACQDARNEHDKDWVIQQFNKHFVNVLVGLGNLKKTYGDDSAVVARLNVMCSLLEQEIKKIKSICFKSHDREDCHVPMK